MIGPYRTATAFRVALEERLRQQALESGAPLDRLRKEIAFQTLFARMTAGDAADGWVLKGAQVLLIRLDERARATKDADTTWRHEASALQAALDDAMEPSWGMASHSRSALARAWRPRPKTAAGATRCAHFLTAASSSSSCST